jgi:hypothetical protein
MKFQQDELLKVINRSSPFERTSNFGLEMTFLESRFISFLELSVGK